MTRIHIPRQYIPRLKNRIVSLYIEHARVSVKNDNVVFESKTGLHSLPAASVAILMLGPGTSITHDASQVLSECGTLCAWCDSFGGNCHSFIIPNTNVWTDSTRNIEQQAKIVATAKLRTQAVRKMFLLRYGDEYDQTKKRSISHMRGIEGRHVRKTYENCAREFGVKWNGRVARASDMDSDDTANFIITMTMQEIYNVVTAVCHAIGCATSLGILHKGHSRSFVFDIADLWKESKVIPFAFEQSAILGEGVNIRLYEHKKLIRSIIKDFVERECFVQRSVEAIDEILWGS